MKKLRGNIPMANKPTYEELGLRVEELEKELGELKRVEEALLEGEGRYRTLIEESFDGIFVQKRAKIVFTNRSLNEMLGYDEGELLGSDHWIVFHPDYQELTRSRAQARMRGEIVPSQYEVKLQCKDGSWFYGEVNAKTISFEKEPGVQVWIRDITEPKQAREALLESEKRFRTIVETTPAWLWEVNRDSIYSYVSPKVKELLGYEPEEVAGKTPFDFMPRKEVKRVKLEFRDIIKSRRQFMALENVNIHKDGRSVIMETSGVPIFDINGHLCGYRGINRDITEKKRAEQGLKEREEELEIKTSSLKEVNTALKVLLKRRDEDKIELEEKVLLNVKDLVLPYLEKLKKSGLGKRERSYLDILESNLNDIISPFSRRLSPTYLNFTPSEIQVANLLKHGKTTKDIAEFLNLSCETIDFHRKNIRKKIGIKNKKANLRTYLLSIQ